MTVPESRFDHDSEASVEEEEAEEGEEAGDVTPQSPSHSATPEDNYVPESPPISPVELKKELPKYLPALQVHTHACFHGARLLEHSRDLLSVYLCVCGLGLSERRGVPVFEPHRGRHLRSRLQSQRQEDG